MNARLTLEHERPRSPSTISRRMVPRRLDVAVARRDARVRNSASEPVCHVSLPTAGSDCALDAAQSRTRTPDFDDRSVDRTLPSPTSMSTEQESTVRGATAFCHRIFVLADLTSRGGIKLRTTLDEPTPRARVASTFPITRSTRRSESKSSKRATPCWLLRAPPARAITASQTQGRVPLRRGEKLIRQGGLP